MKKNLCIIALLCIISAGQIFAQNNSIDHKHLLKPIRYEKINNLSPEYINSIEQLYLKQVSDKEYNKALKTLDYLILANKSYYGDFSQEVGFSYLLRGRYYNGFMIFDKTKKDMDKVYELALKNKSKELLFNSYIGYTNYYSAIEQHYDTIKYLNKLNDGSDRNNFESKYFNLASAYAAARNFKTSYNYYQKAYKEISANPNNLELKKFFYHLKLATLYKDNSKYNLAFQNYNEAEKILSNIKDDDKSLLIRLNMEKIQHYQAVKNYTAQKELMDKTAEILKEYGEEYQRENLVLNYIDYYKNKKCQNETKEYIKKAKKYNKGKPKNSLMFLSLTEKEIDVYKDFQQPEKADLLANKCIKSVEPVKEYAPLIYGKFLRKSAEVKKALNKIEESKLLLDEAKKIYESVLPESAYEFYQLHKEYAELYNAQGKTDEAIKEYNTAIEINKALQGESHKDIAEIYEQLANIYSGRDEKKAEEYRQKAEKIHQRSFCG